MVKVTTNSVCAYLLGGAMTKDRLTQLCDFAARYTAAWCSQNAANIPKFFAPSGSLTINGGTPSAGRIEITQAAQGFMTAFPDLKVYMDDLVEKQGKILYHSLDLRRHAR